MELSVCGLDCSKCQYFMVNCNGCKAVEGSTFWAKEFLPNKVCSLYECAVTNKGFNSCGDCKELPCKMFVELKDPNSTEEEHQKSIKERVIRLSQN